MGIEPTDHMISIRPNGFEDRGLHQQSKHFRVEQREAQIVTKFDGRRYDRFGLFCNRVVRSDLSY